MDLVGSGRLGRMILVGIGKDRDIVPFFRVNPSVLRVGMKDSIVGGGD